MNDITLLENGLDYILNALINLEKIENKKHSKYTIKYIIRDLISGIEIIFKYRLEMDNWAFVIDNLDSIAINDYNLGNFVSVTLEKAIERLNNLCKIKLDKNDVNILKRLKEIRNRIEHFKYNLNEIQTITIVNDCISIILKFINNDNESFKTKFTNEEENLFKDINDRVLKLQNYLSQKENDIKSKYPTTPFVECPKCHKECLIFKKTKSICYLCDSEFVKSTYHQIKYIKENQPSYRDIQKGACPIEKKECPNCSDTLIWDYENGKAICFDCGFEDDIENIVLCESCGEVVTDEETELCTRCFEDYVESRLDDYAQYQLDLMRGK